MFDTTYLLMFESPIQIAIVLIIALLVFGPQKLPEIGKQIGSALRELKRAGSEVMNSFNADHEPDRDPYRNNDYNYNGYNYPNGSDYSVPQSGYEPPADLTDYTIAGQPPADTYNYGYDQPHSEGVTVTDDSSYALAHSGGDGPTDDFNATDSGAPAASATGDAEKEGSINA